MAHKYHCHETEKLSLFVLFCFLGLARIMRWRESLQNFWFLWSTQKLCSAPMAFCQVPCIKINSWGKSQQTRIGQEKKYLKKKFDFRCLKHQDQFWFEYTVIIIIIISISKESVKCLRILFSIIKKYHPKKTI